MPDLYGLVGKNIGYSKSPELFKNFFKIQNLNAEYLLFDLESINQLEKILQNPNLKGFNVTIPYKNEILQYLDVISPEALKLQAVNTVKISGGKLIGYNTDIYGFELALKKHLKPAHKHALILGNGATAKTVRHVLDTLDITHKTVSRKKSTRTITYKELTPETIRRHLLIINTTPLGNLNFVNQKPPIPYEAITPQHYLFDLNYNPPVSLFLWEGKKRNAQTQNGLKMLELQARKAWEIWQKK